MRAHHTPSIIRWHDGAVSCAFPFDRQVVARLKADIPARHRSYDRLTKSWTVAQPYAWHAECILREAFEFVDVEDAGAAPIPIRTADADFAELHLLSSAPAELIEAAYRCLARSRHPDIGGDTVAMQRLNNAYDSLKQRGAA